MNYHINFCKIASEYLLEHLNITQVAERHQIPKSAVVRALFKYIEAYPTGNYSSILYRKLKVEIVKDLLASTGSRKDFANKYGMTLTKLMELVSDVIQDKELIRSNNLANTIYIKLISGSALCVKAIPQRIVHYIGECYINNGCTCNKLALLYGCHRNTISAVLRRGIAENIFSDQLAEKVYTKMHMNALHHEAANKCFELAFEQREKNNQIS